MNAPERRQDARELSEDHDVRRRVGHLESEVGDLKEGQARLEVGVQGIMSDVGIIVKKLNQPAPKKDTWGMVSALGGLLVIFSSFMYIVLQPVIRDVDSLHETQKENNALYLENADTAGYNRAKQEDQHSFMLGLSDRYKEIQVEMINLEKDVSALKASGE